MALNTDIYPNKYSIRIQQTTDSQPSAITIPCSPTLKELVDSNKMLPNTPWDSSNSYAGVAITDASLVGLYTNTFFPDYEEEEQSLANIKTNIKKVTGTQLNLRFFVDWHTSTSSVSYGLGFRWTGLAENLAQLYKSYADTNSTYTAYDPFFKSSGQPQVLYGNESTLSRLSAITTLDINRLIFVPTFSITTLTFSGKVEGHEGVFTSVSSRTDAYTWSQLKPEDKTPAGDYYEEYKTLFSSGWEEVQSEIAGTRVFRYCNGAKLVPYYGSRDSVYDPDTDSYNNENARYGPRSIFGASPSDTGQYPELPTLSQYPILVPLIEEYNPDLRSVVYRSFTGLAFDRTSSALTANRFGFGSYYQLNTEMTTFSGSGVHWNPLTYYPPNVSYSGIYSTQSEEESTVPVVVLTDAQFAIDETVLNFPETSANLSYFKILFGSGGTYSSYRVRFKQFIPSTDSCFAIEKLWSTIATLGCYIADSQSTAQQAPLGKNINGNNHIYCGFMGADGITTGEMVQGGDILDLPQTGMSDILADTPYTPVDPTPNDPLQPDTDKDGKDTGTVSPAGKVTLGATNGLVTYYVLTASQVRAIGKSLWGSTTPTELLKNFFLYDISQSQTNYEISYSEILDYLVGLKYYPFNIGLYADTQDTRENGIRLGTGVTMIEGNPYMTTSILTNPIAVIDAGSCIVPSYYGSFMDSEPIAVASLYVPFCGTTDLLLSAITDKPLSLTYYVDMVTGCCVALVQAIGSDGVYPVAEMTGVLGFDMMLTGNNNNQQLSSIVSSLKHMALGSLGSIASAVGGAVAGSTRQVISGSMGAVGDLASTAINMPQTASLHPMTSGTSASLAALASYHTAFIQVKRKNSITPASYGSTVGYLSAQTATIGSLIGFTQVDNPDLTGIPATAQELDMIRDLLTSGFYA